MSILVAPQTTTPTSTVAPPQTDQPLILDAVRSEWVKLRSLRSTYWTFLATAGMMIGVGRFLTDVSGGAFELLNRYEVRLWRQAVQILMVLQSIRLRFPAG